jgi:hypothetical protein
VVTLAAEARVAHPGDTRVAGEAFGKHLGNSLLAGGADRQRAEPTRCEEGRPPPRLAGYRQVGDTQRHGFRGSTGFYRQRSPGSPFALAWRIALAWRNFEHALDDLIAACMVAA